VNSHFVFLQISAWQQQGHYDGCHILFPAAWSAR